jgi:peptidyl-prolyl cis-trans isomerase B (cyclophilin B)
MGIEMTMKKVLAILAIAPVLFLTACGSSSNDAASTTDSPSAQPSTSSSDKPTTLKECKTSTAQGHTPATVSQPKSASASLPKTLTLKTNCGDIVISLNAKAPLTVTSIAALANAKYFNNSLCHRLTTEGLFVLQCGDPTATGSGSPTGWSGYADENLPKEGTNNYPAGTVAMANSGPGTNGSQFFLVYDNTTLGANYTIWGTITKGLDLVKKISTVGAFTQQDGNYYYTGDGYPVQTVEILSATAK